MNKFIKFLLRPTLNAVDFMIFFMVVALAPQLGLWVFIPALGLTFLNNLWEKKVGWEVFNNSRD